MNIWTMFINLIFEILKSIYNLVKDWGLAIIVLTALFRLLLWPLTVKQTRSMVSMQKIQPLMKEIQEKYADDKEKQNEEMMKLYSEHKVNPLSGCLPMLIQMPLLIAFYSVLAAPMNDAKTKVIARVSPLARYLGYSQYIGQKASTLFSALDRVKGSFFGIIPDIMLSPKMAFERSTLYAVPYVALLIIFGVSIVLPTLMMPQGDNAQARQQKTTSYTMAAFMLFIGFSIPAGALLYYDVSSLIAVGQQYLTQKAIDKENAGTKDIVVKSKKGGKK